MQGSCGRTTSPLISEAKQEAKEPAKAAWRAFLCEALFAPGRCGNAGRKYERDGRNPMKMEKFLTKEKIIYNIFLYNYVEYIYIIKIIVGVISNIKVF